MIGPSLLSIEIRTLIFYNLKSMLGLCEAVRREALIYI